MAYNYYNLGILGVEVKRRLDMLKDIEGDNTVASTDYVKSVINYEEQKKTAYIDAGEIKDIILESEEE